MSTDPRTEIELEMEKLPPAVNEAYREARSQVEQTFGDEEIVLWAKEGLAIATQTVRSWDCLLYTSPSPRDATLSRMPSSA